MTEKSPSKKAAKTKTAKKKAAKPAPKRNRPTSRSSGRAVIVEKKRAFKINLPSAPKEIAAKKTPTAPSKPAAKTLPEKQIEVKSQPLTKSKTPSKTLTPSTRSKPAGTTLRALTKQEKQARAASLAHAKQQQQLEQIEQQDQKKATQKEKTRKTSEEKKKQETKPTEQQPEPISPPEKEEETRKRSAKESEKQFDEPPEKVKKPSGQKRPLERKRRQNRLTIANALDETERQQSLSALRRRQQKQKPSARANTLSPDSPKQHIVREVVIPETIAVIDLAARMAVRTGDVIKFLFTQDIIVKANDHLDADTAELVCGEFGHKVKRITEADVEEAIDATEDKPKNLKPRPPVITIMGHVDHGKTSLLDALRKSAITQNETGGITQHIGAYQTQIANGQTITVIDTPGHEAFTAMRSRGAKITDIVILVIAADEGVMPQTIESINHAKAANTPIILALNKMDKPGANPDKVMRQLLQYEVITEAQGGDVQAVPLSAKTGEGLDQLGEAISLQADLLDLKANPNRPAQGTVLEARLDKGAGHVATVLIQRGTLKKGDVFVAGQEGGKVRRMKAYDGSDLKQAGPSCPVWVVGLSAPVEAGDQFDVVEHEARAREIAEYRQRKKLHVESVSPQERSIEQIFAHVKQKEELYYIIKADVQGSADAIAQAAKNIGGDKVQIKIIHAGVGEVNASDIMLAETVNAKILMFNVKASKEAQKAAAKAKINLYAFDVIYALIDEIKNQVVRFLGPERRETILGQAEILQLFGLGRKNIAAGCKVTEGHVKNNSYVRIRRGDILIYDGNIQSLKRFKENVSEVDQGQECGIAFDDPPPLQPGDHIECFDVELIEQQIE